MSTTKHVLIIEDDKSILDAMQMALEFEGYTVHISPNGEVAKELIAGTRALPDVVLLDMLLSGADGREICKALKAEKKTKAIPVIMMSAHPKAEKSVQEAGADFFLAKPFNIEDLLGTVAKCVA